MVERLRTLSVEHLKVLISRAPCRVLAPGGYSFQFLSRWSSLLAHLSLTVEPCLPLPLVEQLKFQFTYWVGGLTVEPLPVLWSSKKLLPFLLVKSWEQSIP